MKSLENLGVQALSARFMLGKACKESQTAWDKTPKCCAKCVGAGIYSLSLSRLSVLPILPHSRLFISA